MINSIMNIGVQAMLNAQVGISVTSDNISNAGNADYSRRTVNLETNSQLSLYGLSLGNGASVAEIERHFNAFIEDQYLDMSSQEAFWNTQAEILYNIETLFGESDDYGLSTALDQFMSALDALAQSPDDEALRQEALDYADVLATTLASIDSALDEAIEGLDSDISSAVDDVNTLTADIADLNAQIIGDPNDTQLQDQRDAKVRELAELVDVKVVRNDDGSYDILTTSGLSLVSGTSAYRLAFEGPQVIEDLDANSSFDGQVYFEGEHSEEISIDFLTSGPADGSSNAASFRVSLDGGKTWLEDEYGQPLLFTAGGVDDKVQIGDVSIWFGQEGDANALATTDISEDDRFTVVSTSGVYWYKNTSSKLNVTPLDADGDADGFRLTGGELAGLIATRNDGLMAYQESLDSLARELAWQVNYQHSQGAGLDHRTHDLALNSVGDTSAPLAESDLSYADRVTEGGLSMAFYDEDTGDSLGVVELDFSSVVPPGLATFDPTQHSLEDVVTAMNASYGGLLTASISNGQLVLQADAGVQFEYAGDSTGLLAAVGLNTFFEGDDAQSLEVSAELADNPSRLCCGHVDGTGYVTDGDNANALALADVMDMDVRLDLPGQSSSMTLSEHLHSLVASVGLDVDTAARNQTLTSTQAQSLYDSQEAVSGVSLDEELVLLTKYQESYEAASRLIQTADEMFDVIMSLKS